MKAKMDHTISKAGFEILFKRMKLSFARNEGDIKKATILKPYPTNISAFLLFSFAASEFKHLKE